MNFRHLKREPPEHRRGQDGQSQTAAVGSPRLQTFWQWGLMVILSIALILGLQAVKLPAALLLGPMVAAICMGIGGATIRVPRIPYRGAQAVIGCLIASAITSTILSSLVADWPLFGGVVLATLAASSVLGWMMSRWRVLPGTTGVWGSSPGAATAMVVMAEAFGADARLVAFMQYVRVVCVAVVASLIARFLMPMPPEIEPGQIDAGTATETGIIWFPQIQPAAFAATLVLVLIGAYIGHRSRLPAGPMLVPMAIGAVLHLTGLIDIQLPEWLLAPAYALLGWHIGLGFTKPVLLHAMRGLPQILLSVAILMGFCGALAFLLTRLLGIDPLSAYLATSPGGMDSIAIIAASTKVDLSFVMALQTMRFLLVLLLGPMIARFVARVVTRRQSS